MLLHLTVVENDNTRVSVILLLHLVFRVDALPLNLDKHTHIHVKGIISRNLLKNNTMHRHIQR